MITIEGEVSPDAFAPHLYPQCQFYEYQWKCSQCSAGSLGASQLSHAMLMQLGSYKMTFGSIWSQVLRVGRWRSSHYEGTEGMSCRRHFSALDLVFPMNSWAETALLTCCTQLRGICCWEDHGIRVSGLMGGFYRSVGCGSDIRPFPYTSPPNQGAN